MNISIIFPIYGGWHNVSKRLWEIHEHCSLHKPEIVLVDDCSKSTEVTKGVEFWRRNGTFEKVITYSNPVNVGFGQTCNKGAELATGDVVVFHSTDVVVSGNYLSQVIESIARNSRSLVGGRLLSFNTGWNTFNGKIYPYLEGWLLACTKEIWNELGGFDPDYGLFDYEDMDASTKALSMGIDLVPLNNPYLYHIGGATIYAVYGVDGRREQTEKNREVFRSKWVK